MSAPPADPGVPDDVSLVESPEALAGMHHPPMSRAADKVIGRLDRHCRAIIARSPFVVLATVGPGGADASPRGDPPGFVAVLDDRHLLLPDRVGNNRFDNFRNVLADGRVGLLFLVPGMNETLRVNGRARLTDDVRLLSPLAVQGRAPKIGLLVTVEEAFVHCAKAFVRSDLWNPARHIDRAELPAYAEMLLDHCAGLTPEESDRQGREMARRGLY